MQSMRKKRFNRPVVVQLGRIDRDRVVGTPAEAAELLLHQWRLPESPERLKAMEACLQVIKGEKPPRVARAAFIKAAVAARVFIGEGLQGAEPRGLQ